MNDFWIGDRSATSTRSAVSPGRMARPARWSEPPRRGAGLAAILATVLAAGCGRDPTERPAAPVPAGAGIVEFAAADPAAAVPVDSPAAEPTTCGEPVPRRPDGALATGSALRLAINIPAFRLDIFEGGARTRSLTISVGARAYPTPTGEFVISEVVWNPWWRPPAADWARGDTITPPGPRNPMGRAKLNFVEDYYIHGTPDRDNLGRAASHGCVRLSNADVLALARLVHHHASPAVSAEALDWLESHPDSTRRIPLETVVPLEVLYEVAEVRDGVLEVHPDVYRREGGAVRERMLEALAGAGLDRATIDSDRLDALLARGRRAYVSAPLDSLRRAQRPR